VEKDIVGSSALWESGPLHEKFRIAC